jgi:hypothetical protein
MCLAAHVLALILPVVSSGQEEYEWKWVLERADPDGVRAAADGATLAHAYQVAGETFIEAERPSGPVVGVETVTDNEASGGTYLVVPEGAGNGPTAELICVLDVRARQHGRAGGYRSVALVQRAESRPGWRAAHSPVVVARRWHGT